MNRTEFDAGCEEHLSFVYFFQSVRYDALMHSDWRDADRQDCGDGNWDLLEALQPDPTRPDAMMWITSYDSLVPSGPLHDLKQRGIRGDDPKMLFSWHSGGDLNTDPAVRDLPPEYRANPSIAAWPDGPAYLIQQKLRLPTSKYRRLHLNLPGGPSNQAFDTDKILSCIVSGRTSLPYDEAISYRSFVDVSGGARDDSVLCIAHRDGIGASSTCSKSSTRTRLSAHAMRWRRGSPRT